MNVPVSHKKQCSNNPKEESIPKLPDLFHRKTRNFKTLLAFLFHHSDAMAANRDLNPPCGKRSSLFQMRAAPVDAEEIALLGRFVVALRKKRRALRGCKPRLHLSKDFHPLVDRGRRPIWLLGPQRNPGTRFAVSTWLSIVDKVKRFLSRSTEGPLAAFLCPCRSSSDGPTAQNTTIMATAVTPG